MTRENFARVHSIQSHPAIAPATPADVPQILNFIRSLAEYEHLAHEMQMSEEDLRRHLFGEKPAAEALIARIDSQPVGFALYFTTFSTFVGKPGIWLEDLFVLPEMRGKGVGRALLQKVAAITVARGCGRLEWSVLDWNEPAIQFYRKLDAVPMKDWTSQRLTGEPLNRLASQP